MKSVTSLLFILSFVPSLLSEPLKAADNQRPLAGDDPAPEVVPPSMFVVPDGFEVTIWARSPLVRNPTNMDIDAQGRIWITEGVNYRRNVGRDPRGDRVVVLEDTNGNGRADRSTTFVQEPGMLSPLGIAVIEDKIIVSNPPDLIVYTDLDRDAVYNPRVDRRDVLLTGFAGKNHDHSLHSVTVGPDGLWYFSHGNTGAHFTDRSNRTFRIGASYDPGPSMGPTSLYSWKSREIAGAKSDDGHVYVGGFTVRINPDGTNAQIIGHNYRNSLEQCVTSFGDVFQNDNDDPPACRTSFVMEHGSAGFFSRDGSRSWQADRRPGQSTPVAEWRQDDPGTMPPGDVYGRGAPTGIVYYEGDLFGDQWRGLLISADAGRNTLLGYFPKPHGAGYLLERFDFLTTNEEPGTNPYERTGGSGSLELRKSFRPSDVAVGPDGAIYVADWFDPKVGGHQDFDAKTSGAIYRIAPQGFKSSPPRFDLETTGGQIAALKSPAVNVRALGFSRLRARGAVVADAVADLLEDRNPWVRARAVWLLALLGTDGVARVEAQLQSPEPMMRITAFRALRRINRNVFAHTATLAADGSPAVRREAALALRDVPFAKARELLLQLARGYDGRDRAYLEAWGIGCTGKEDQVFTALATVQTEKNAVKWPAAYAPLVWRLTPAAAVADFFARASGMTLSSADRVAAVTALGFIATADAATALLDLAQHGNEPVKTQALWWLLNYKDTRWKAFGTAAAMKARSLYDPEKFRATSVLVPAAPVTKLPTAAVVGAMAGDAGRGAARAQLCLTCHRIGAQGIDYAPDLTGFAKRQSRESVVEAVLKPSVSITHGYDGAEIRLKDDTIIHGLVLSNTDPLVVRSTGGYTQMIPAEKIVERRPLRRSLMLSADQLGLSAQDVADIVTYLETQN